MTDITSRIISGGLMKTYSFTFNELVESGWQSQAALEISKKEIRKREKKGFHILETKNAGNRMDMHIASLTTLEIMEESIEHQ